MDTLGWGPFSFLIKAITACGTAALSIAFHSISPGVSHNIPDKATTRTMNDEAPTRGGGSGQIGLLVLSGAQEEDLAN